MATAAALVAATPATAATVFFAPGNTSGLSGGTMIADFDPSRVNPALGTFSSTGPLVDASTCPTGGCLIQNDTDSLGAAPAFQLSGNYLSVVGGGTVQYLFNTALNSLSFVYGSADTYNTLTVLTGSGGVFNFTGDQIVGAGNATGNRTSPNSNGVVFISGAAGGITGIRLSSSQNSFEIDNLRANPVPEPGTWAMMLMGFGAVGFAMRRRKSRAVLQVA